MKFSSMRSAIVIASVVAGSVIPTQAFAQIDVFSSVRILEYGVNGTSISTYRFNSSMILNSIDFGTGGNSYSLSYQIGTGAFQSVDNSLLSTKDAFGYQRIYLGALTVDSGTDVKVRIVGNHTIASDAGSVNAASNVSYLGSDPDFGNTTRFNNSNIRVYNPGSTVPGASVAPEPGTFALALTGGAALLGICIRRRRNAA
jgi:hypothetical protein